MSGRMTILVCTAALVAASQGPALGRDNAPSNGPRLAQVYGSPARDDLLDQLVRRLTMCSEIADTTRRLDCYDRVQSGGERAAAGNLPPPASAVAPASPGTTPALAPPPVMRGDGCSDNPVNCAFDPRGLRGTSSLPVGGTRELQRIPGAPPARGVRQPLAAMRIDNLRSVEERWILTATVTSAASRIIDPAVACSMTNGGSPVAELTYTITAVQPGESVVLQMVGPAVTSAYVDGANCRILAPLQ